MSKKVPLPDWCREAKKAMIDRDDMSVQELAEGIGNGRAFVSCVLNGSMEAPAIKRKIQDYLGISQGDNTCAS